MTLETIVSAKRDAIAERWLGLIQETYPGDTTPFLKKGGVPFQNPVAEIFAESVPTVVASLLGEVEHAEIVQSLDAIVRIRAVQEFAPSQSVAIVFLLKKAIREELEGEIRFNGLHGELLDIEERIDGLALLAFDCYTECREKIHNIRAGELKRRTHRLLEKSSWVTDDSGLPTVVVEKE